MTRPARPARSSISFATHPPLSLLLGIAAVLAEAILLARTPDGVFRGGLLLATLAAAALISIWFAAIWLLRTAARGVRHLTRFWSRPATFTLVIPLVLLLDAAALIYISSWAFYLRTGSFARLDALRYAWIEYRDMTWFYVRRSEPTSLAMLGVVIVGICVALPLVLAKAARSDRARVRLPVRPGLLWLTATAIAVVLFARVQSDRSEIRKPVRLEAVKLGLNPWVALAVSGAEASRREPIEPVLDIRELRESPGMWSIPPGTDRPSIVFVKIESMRADVLHRRHQGIEITPNLNALARLGVEFTRAYSPTTHTDYADVSVLSSSYPLRTRDHHYYRASDPWPKTLIYDLLKRADYATALVAAENLAWGSMDRFLRTPNLDFFFDAERSGGAARVDMEDDGIAREIREGVLSAGILEDELTTDIALRWARTHIKAGQPFFLALDLQSAHFPYEVPARAARPFHPSTIDFDVSFVRYPYKKTDVVRNAYYNALHESDRNVGLVIKAFREAGVMNDTVLVVYADHGEAFREKGHITHAAQPIEVVVRVPCLIVAPGRLQPRKDDYPAELIDLPPTILALLGWPPHPNFQGIDLFGAERPSLDERVVFLHTENPLSHADAVVLGGRWKFLQDRFHRHERLYDLTESALEERDLHRSRPLLAAALKRLLSDWRRRQLAYYHFPMYFEGYYPPRAPTPTPAEIATAKSTNELP